MKKLNVLSFMVFSLCTAQCSMAQKIAIDQKKPISGSRLLGTFPLSIFQMQVIQVAAFCEISPKDTVSTLAFYFRTPSLKLQIPIDTVKPVTIILLNSNEKVQGEYVSTAVISGFQVHTYRFTFEDFLKLSERDATAISIGRPGEGTNEFELGDKHQKAIGKVCSTILKEIK